MTWQADCQNFSQYNPERYPRGLNSIVQYSQKIAPDFYIYFLKKNQKSLDYCAPMLYNMVVGLRNTSTNTEYASNGETVQIPLKYKAMEAKYVRLVRT